MKKCRIVLVLVSAFLLVLTGCQKDTDSMAASTTMPAAEETTEAVMETIAETTEAAAPELLERPESGKVCVGFMPTEAGSWRYVVIPDQDTAVAAYEKAVNAKYSDEWWIKGDRTQGLMVVYGDIWDFVESGELVYALGRVKAEDARELYGLCAAAAKEMGWKEPVTPEQLTNLTAATLRQKDVEVILTDAQALEKLETMLSAGKYELGGTGCPFTAMLDVETAAGEVLTIALATDSCGAWMSEGYYYSYGSDSQPLYDLFDVHLDSGRLTVK